MLVINNINYLTKNSLLNTKYLPKLNIKEGPFSTQNDFKVITNENSGYLLMIGYNVPRKIHFNNVVKKILKVLITVLLKLCKKLK